MQFRNTENSAADCVQANSKSTCFSFAPNLPAETELVESDDFISESLHIFNLVDKDRDGFLSAHELGAAVQSSLFEGRDAQVVAALYKNKDYLARISDDQWFFEDSITRRDLETVTVKEKQDDQKAFQALWFFCEDSNFLQTDCNQDKFLTKEEIALALKRQDLSPSERLSLEFLQDHLSEIATADDDGQSDAISFHDINLHPYRNQYLAESSCALMRTNLSQLTSSKRLYDNEKNPLASINPEAIMQGWIGDCHFLAALASLAASDPEKIYEMIADNHDGTYTVTFPGNRHEPVTVTAPTEAEMGIYNQGGPDGTWACVLEKAFGLYSQRYPWRRSIFNFGGGYTVTEGADNGEHPFALGNAMNLLTGESNDRIISGFQSQAELRTMLINAFCQGRKQPTIAGTLPGCLESAVTPDGFPRQHMFSVLDFDPDGPDGGTVTVRNPWGDEDGTTGGTIAVSLKTFMRNFRAIACTN